jgi:hypothetical protein
VTASEPDREQLNAALTMPCLRCGIDMPIEAAIPVMFASGLYEVIYRCSECGGRVRCPTRVERAVTGWQPIETAPANRLIEVGTLGGYGVRAFAFRVRKTDQGWVLEEGDLRSPMPINPTHWRDVAGSYW